MQNSNKYRLNNFLKNEKIVNYLLPIICLPFLSLIVKESLIFLFQLGNFGGTFIRALYELVMANL